MERNLKKGHLLAFTTVLIWSYASISSKILLESFGPVELFFYRMLIAYAALVIIKPGIIKYKNMKEELVYIAAGITGVTLYFILQNVALLYSFASNVGVLLTISPFFTAVLSYFIFKDEKLQSKFFIGFGITLAGVFLISYNGNQVLKLNPIGDMMAILAAFAWAVYSVLMKKVSSYKYNTILSTRKIFFYGLVFLIPALVYTDFHFSVAKFYDIGIIANMLFLALGASALTYVLWNDALGILGPVKTSMYLYITPIMTMAFSVAVLNERLTPMSLAGVALILGGICFSERKKVREAPDALESGAL
ncbi:MAG TPA: DMT family transporter [Clostridiaceae bacterium]